MNFTREPIIETVITPREGCKLLVRSSKGTGQEEYSVDAVEVVSFGHSFFFRSLERPRSFLVPVSDYEILESKETRAILKNVPAERSIKIGGGREAPPRAPRESSAEEAPSERSQERGKRGDKRRRGRGRRDRQELPSQEKEPPFLAEPPPSPPVEEQKSPSFISKLFPPPPTLIKETLSRYKPSETPEGGFQQPPEEKYEETLFDRPTPSEPPAEPDSEDETRFED